MRGIRYRCLRVRVKVRAILRRRWQRLLLFAVVVVVSGSISWRWLGETRTPDHLLKGAPEFVILSLLLVLSGYLRQASTNAVAFWEKIRSGQDKAYPLGQVHTRHKLRALLETRQNLEAVATFMIALTILVAVRIACDAALRFPNTPYADLSKFLFVMDWVIAAVLTILLFALAMVHHAAQQREERLQRKTKDYLVRTFSIRGREPEPTMGTRTIQATARPATRGSSARVLLGLAALLLIAGRNRKLG